MILNKFIKKSSLRDDAIGNLAKDILSDENFSKTKTDKEIYNYLELKIGSDHVVKDTLDAFWSEYLDLKK